MRREFQLPEQDVDHLSTLQLDWETLSDGGLNWVIVYRFPVPLGYNVPVVDVAITIQPGYPVTQLDMAYFHPHLQLMNQRTIAAVTFQQIDGKSFQRWSRHRTPANPWRPGIDDLSTHLACVAFWFERELKK